MQNEKGSLQKLFIPYKEALALKKLGFDEPCLGYYLCKNSAFGIVDLLTNTDYIDLMPYDSASCKVPTVSQAFEFFRKKYGLFVQPNRTVDSEGIWYYFSISAKRTDVCEGSFIYEEAELACLQKLIEIVKITKG